MVTRETPQTTDGEGMKSRGAEWPAGVCQASEASADLILLSSGPIDQPSGTRVEAQNVAHFLKSAPQLPSSGCLLRSRRGNVHRQMESTFPKFWSLSLLLLLTSFFRPWSENGPPQCEGDPGTARTAGKETDERFLFLLRGSGEQFITKEARGDPDRSSYQPGCTESRISS